MNVISLINFVEEEAHGFFQTVLISSKNKKQYRLVFQKSMFTEKKCWAIAPIKTPDRDLNFETMFCFLRATKILEINNSQLYDILCEVVGRFAFEHAAKLTEAETILGRARLEKELRKG